jgi:hypothetical protein
MAADQIEMAEYGVSENQRGMQAPNRAHNLRTYFKNEGIEVVPRTGEAEGAWRLAWRTVAWGREGRLIEVGVESLKPEINGARVEYDREGIVEWYENKKAGLEQGFRVGRRPEGEGPLRLEGRVEGDLTTKLDTAQSAIDFLNENGTAVLRYSELHVCDARGSAVPSRLEVDGDKIVILVDDENAEYPIVIDPLVTSPSWAAEGNQAGATFGWSVGTAGDVNGDGYSDVIVGAYLYDFGVVDGGRAYVYHGSSTGLTGPEWTKTGAKSEGWLGYSVGTAGDVNGDGYSDVVIGAPRQDLGNGSESGVAFVYHGSSSGLSGTLAWSKTGHWPDARFGHSVGTAGDVNGDGYSDVIVGSPQDHHYEIDEGRAFVYEGADTGLSDYPAWSAESDQAEAWFGYSVGTAGDVNGDGYSDVIVGAPKYDADWLDEGRGFVYHGSSTGLSASPAWTARSDKASAWYAQSVGTAGDVNGDGYSDVIVGAPHFSSGYAEAGKAYVYHGSSTGLDGSASWTIGGTSTLALLGHSVGTAGDVNGDGCADVVIGVPQYGGGRVYMCQGSSAGLSFETSVLDSYQSHARFGICVATAGDYNGDGYSDVIVGADWYDNGDTAEGRAYVYRGGAGGLRTVLAGEGNQDSAHFGVYVGTAGDVNGDGYSDVIVGAPSYDNGETDEGRAFVYHGTSTGLSGTAAWTAESDQASANFGISVGTAGDVNGDGYSDVIVGAYYYDDGQSNEGRAYVFHGASAGLSGAPAWTAESNQAEAHFGRSVGAAGDVNGDGYSDVIVGADAYDNGQTDEGSAFVYHGSAAGLFSTPAWTAESDQVSSGFGTATGTAGDVNGDGYSDVVVGAYAYDGGDTDEGRAYAYHGAATGLSSTPAWTAECDQVTARFGFAVGTAGDVNNDGFSDVIVGAYLHNSYALNDGSVFVYHGSPGGLQAGAAWTAGGVQESARFGCSVGTAGDVNMDGYSDVVVGAYMYDDSGTDDGRVYIYLGSSAGVTATGAKYTGCGQDYAHFGCSVSTAGDVNGDGFADVIAGADLYDNGETDEGIARIVYGNEGRGRHRVPRQLRPGTLGPIQALGMSGGNDGFVLRTLGRTAGGRGKIRLQCEVKPVYMAFYGTGLLTSPAYDTGAPGAGGSVVTLEQLVTGLETNELYHWRLRVLTDSPFFPRSPWFSPAFNGAWEADVRVGVPDATAIEDFDTPAPGLMLLESVAPNPFGKSVELRYALPERGDVRLAVYDVAGREVAVLRSGVEEPGPHAMSWDGRGGRGEHLASGVYFIRLTHGGRSDVRKIVITR